MALGRYRHPRRRCGEPVQNVVPGLHRREGPGVGSRVCPDAEKRYERGPR
jgi:hypothetical protein